MGTLTYSYIGETGGEEVERRVGQVRRWPKLRRETARWIVQKVVGAGVHRTVFRLPIQCMLTLR